MKPVEYEIPVPWGYIAAKLWGDEKNPPILMVHGFMDNAASFDRLIPHLPTQFYYICIDMPGHGKSSHFPPYTSIYFLNFLMAIRIVLDHFNRKKYVILTHSFGAAMSIMYAQVYPEYVSKLIMIDFIYFTPTPAALAQKMILNQHFSYARYIKAEMKGEVAGQTYEQLLEKLLVNRFMGEISTESMKLIMERMLVSLEDGKYKLSLDNRLRTMYPPLLDYQGIIEFLEECPVRCPTLVILYDGVNFYNVFFSKLIGIFMKNPLFTVKFLNGNHDLHCDQPEKVSPVLARFLMKDFSKL